MKSNDQILRVPKGADKLVKWESSGTCCLCPLRHLCIPGAFSEREVHAFEHAITRRRRVDKNERVDRQFERSQTLHIIRFGQFKKVVHDLNGNERVAGFQMASDVLGLDAMAHGQDNAQFLAIEDSEVCEIPFTALTRLLNNEPSFQQKFLRNMGEALHEEYRNTCILASPSLDQRFAAFILTLSDKYARLGYARNSFRLNMSRSDMASYLGTTIESVSRVISRFNAQGAMSIQGRSVELTDRLLLQALMGGEQRLKAKLSSAIVTLAQSGETNSPCPTPVSAVPATVPITRRADPGFAMGLGG